MKSLPVLVALAFAIHPAQAAVVTVSWSTNRSLYHYPGGLPLTAGTEAEGDGARLELGFFDLATTSDPFAGDWQILTVASVGDDGRLADGFFAITTPLEEDRFGVRGPRPSLHGLHPDSRTPHPSADVRSRPGLHHAETKAVRKLVNPPARRAGGRIRAHRGW